MNGKKGSGKCDECGSTKRVEGQTHYMCEGCGVELEELEPDPGFVIGSQAPMALRPSNDRNLLGGHIDKSADKVSEKFRKAHVITSYKKPLFIDIAIRELVERCGVNRVSEAAARLLIEADSKEKLGRIRKKRHGTKGMSKDESRDYRARAFAAAALHILNSDGQSNTAPQVARDWGLAHLDLASSIRILRRSIAGVKETIREDPSTTRYRELRHEISRLRSFLQEQFDMEEVNRIIEAATKILVDEGEPLGANGDWLTGRFCNMPSTKAAFEAAITAMAELGMPLRSARRLYERLPITGMSHFMERCSGLFVC